MDAHAAFASDGHRGGFRGGGRGGGRGSRGGGGGRGFGGRGGRGRGRGGGGGGGRGGRGGGGGRGFHHNGGGYNNNGAHGGGGYQQQPYAAATAPAYGYEAPPAAPYGHTQPPAYYQQPPPQYAAAPPPNGAYGGAPPQAYANAQQLYVPPPQQPTAYPAYAYYPPQHQHQQPTPSAATALLPTPTPTPAPTYDRQQAYLPRSSSTAVEPSAPPAHPPLPPGPPPSSSDFGPHDSPMTIQQETPFSLSSPALSAQSQSHPQSQSQTTPPLPSGPPPPSPVVSAQQPPPYYQQQQPPNGQQHEYQQSSSYNAALYAPAYHQQQPQPPSEYSPHQPQPQPQPHQHQPYQTQYQTQPYQSQPSYQAQPPAYPHETQPHRSQSQPTTHHRPPPPTYCCHKCRQPGHWIQQCPLVLEENQQKQSQQNQHNQHRPSQHHSNQWNAGPSQAPPLGHGHHHHYQSNPFERPDPQHLGRPAFQEYEPRTASFQRQPPPQSHAPFHQPPPYEEAPCSLPRLPASEGNANANTTMNWHCEPCEKAFPIESQHVAHLKTHVSCPAPDCDFSASKRVVGAHFQTTHGQYAGNGLKEIDVEGQKFMVLVGDSPEDIEKWRAERRMKWPSSAIMTRKASAGSGATILKTKAKTTAQAKALVVPVGAVKRKREDDEEGLEDGEIEEGEVADEAPTATTAAVVVVPPTSNGGEENTLDSTGPENDGVDKRDEDADAQEFVEPVSVSAQFDTTAASPLNKKIRPTLLCRKFLRNQCAFGDSCKFSHDRKAFACRTMQQKGACAKGDACLYSHDDALIQQQTQQQQTAKQGKVLEEKWKTEQGSLLRKLLKTDIVTEQRKMLQMVSYFVQEQFFHADQ